MTKKQKNSEIINRFLTFVEDSFPQYEISDDSGDGRIQLYLFGGTSDDTIEFHRSRFTLDIFNWASPEIKADCSEMEEMLEIIKKEVEELED